MDRRQMLKLMATACTGRDDDGAGRLGVYLLHEGRSDVDREIVFSLKRAEGADIVLAGHRRAVARRVKDDDVEWQRGVEVNREAGRARVIVEFTWPDVVRRCLEVYEMPRRHDVR